MRVHARSVGKILAFATLAILLYRRSPNKKSDTCRSGVDSSHVGYEEGQKWWQRAIFYEIYIRSFKDSDGDGNGDINGIVQKLAYLKHIGMDAIWISTIFKSPMVGFGYDVTDFRDVDPLFGTLQDFKALIKAAHNFDIRVIIDLIPNHTSIQHPWFLESRKSRNNSYSDYYMWSSGIWNEVKQAFDPPNNWESLSGEVAWKWVEERQQFYYHTFLREMPDLNLRNEKVVRELHDIIRFWVDFGVDGFRIDGVRELFEDKDLTNGPVNPNFDPTQYSNTRNPRAFYIYQRDLPENFEFLQRIADFVHSLEEEKGRELFTVTEAYGFVNKLKYYQTGVSFSHNLLLAQSWRQGNTTRDIMDRIGLWLDDLPSEYWPNWVMSNHDGPRLTTRLGGHHYASVVNTLLMLLPGTPTVYNGEEIGMVDEDAPEASRAPIPWTDESPHAGFADPSVEKCWKPVNASFPQINVAKQLNDPKSPLEHFRFLTLLRKQAPFASTDAQYEFIDLQDTALFAFARFLPNYPQSYVIVVNHGIVAKMLDFSKIPIKFGSKFCQIDQVWRELDTAETFNQNSAQKSISPGKGLILVTF